MDERTGNRSSRGEGSGRIGRRGRGQFYFCTTGREAHHRSSVQARVPLPKHKRRWLEEMIHLEIEVFGQALSWAGQSPRVFWGRARIVRWEGQGWRVTGFSSTGFRQAPTKAMKSTKSTRVPNLLR